MNQADLAQENSLLNAQNIELKKTLARLEKQLNKTLNKSQAKLVDLEQQLEISAIEKQMLATQNKSLASEKETLDNQVKSLASEKETLDNQVKSLASEKDNLAAKLKELKQQLDWYKRQLFGDKSEKSIVEIDSAVQPSLFEFMLEDLEPASEPEKETIAYTRKKKTRNGCATDSGLRFSDDVPRKVIKIDVPKGLEHCEVIDTKVTYKLAQRRTSNVVLEYHYPVLKDPNSGKIHNINKPNTVFTGSIADVSFLAGLILDKFAYHLPLYRQHQRLAQAGISLSRTTLTNLVARTAALLSPIHIAQLENILKSQVLCIDETPIKAGKANKGKLNRSYFWPLYGDCDEVSFTFSDTRARAHIDKLLSNYFNGTILTDGYKAYDSFVAKQNKSGKLIEHANCWAHARRKLEYAKQYYPQAGQALDIIAKLYRIEDEIRQKNLQGEDLLKYRSKNSEPIVHEFWRWCDTQLYDPNLEPNGKLAKAIDYSIKAKDKLQVFLANPSVAIDNNHIERSIRPIALGRKNWLFCWSEVGAEHVGIIQSIISTCKLHDIDPYTYLIDVLQRVGIHPASEVDKLTPRLWKQRFADNPLKSDLDL